MTSHLSSEFRTRVLKFVWFSSTTPSVFGLKFGLTVCCCMLQQTKDARQHSRNSATIKATSTCTRIMSQDVVEKNTRLRVASIAFLNITTMFSPYPLKTFSYSPAWLIVFRLRFIRINLVKTVFFQCDVGIPLKLSIDVYRRLRCVRL